MKHANRRLPFKAADLLLIGGLLVVSAVLFLLFWLWPTDGKTAVVQVDGQTVQVLPLDVDTTVVIDGVDGGKNAVRIADGKVTVAEATCPDKVCQRHRAIDRAGQSIICLPNKVVVRVVGGEPAVDAEAG